MRNHVITELGSIAGYVAKSPDGLLADVHVRRGEKLDEERHCSSIDDNPEIKEMSKPSQ